MQKKKGKCIQKLQEITGIEADPVFDSLILGLNTKRNTRIPDVAASSAGPKHQTGMLGAATGSAR
jgi:hypothetical protein